MNISFYTTEDNVDLTRGYGVAGNNVVRSLQSLGHKVPFDDPSCPVQISFCPPTAYKFHDGQYKIGYTPWESTELPAGWLEKMNQCDEVWATSAWVAEVYKNAGVTSPIYVYEHGVEPRWSPVRRERGDVLRYLHVGEPALRKGGQMAVDAFRAVFGDREDVHLTVKAYESHWLRAWTEGKFTTPDLAYNNVTIITRSVSPADLVQLYHDHDALLYPSYGEGFGLIPLQALATGMPVICTDAWAPYAKYLGPLSFPGRWDRSIWSIHPGNVYYPNYEDLKKRILFVHKNFKLVSDHYYNQSEAVAQEYNWKSKTEEAWAHIFEKYS